MKNILAIFKEDLKKLFGNVVNGIVTLGLILLPSIFAFYNIIACWDVFDNTGNVKVAVANTDEGYQSDLIPLRMNLGEQVISALRSNDQIKWEFVSEEGSDRWSEGWSLLCSRGHPFNVQQRHAHLL